MPGWGSWAGPGIKPKKKGEPPKRKQRPRIVQPIINDVLPPTADQYLLPKEDPAIKIPLGPEWLPQRQYRELIQPRVKHRAGVIIEPVTFKVAQKVLEESEEMKEKKKKEKEEKKKKRKEYFKNLAEKKNKAKTAA